MSNKMGRFFVLWGVLLLGVLIETVVWPLVGLRIAPHIVAVWLFGAVVYGWKRLALFGSLFIGLMFDVLYYGQMIGVHALAYGLAVGALVVVPSGHRWLGFVGAQTIGLCVLEFVVLGCYALFGLVGYDWKSLLIDDVLPSIALAAVLALAMMKLMRWVFFLRTPSDEQQFGV
jgi:rod shape-determining protein MreD